jgi:hypothetical protein
MDPTVLYYGCKQVQYVMCKPDALVTAEHSVYGCLVLSLNSREMCGRRPWIKNAEIIVNKDRMNSMRKDSRMAKDIAMALIPYSPTFLEVTWLTKSNSLYLT